MPATEVFKETSRRFSHSATIKLITIGALILALLLPVEMVKSLIYERQIRQQGVINEINAKWGQEQTVTGPVISIPYVEHLKDDRGKVIAVTKYLHFLPDTVRIDSRITPKVRSRGIYEAVLYNTTLSIAGSFPQISIDGLRIPPEDILWRNAFISLGISDMRGIKERIGASFDGGALTMEPGVETADVITSGASAGIRLDDGAKPHPFQFELNLNGSQQINFIPVGKVTTVTAGSKWKDPSFCGAFLPAERTVTEQGFEAKWKILHLNRNYPQYWRGSGQDIGSSAFGIRLFKPVDIYQKTMRTAKYALMFIVFTFMAFFISEVMKHLKVHPVQYLQIGLAIIIFYALLLSFAEQVHFATAYLISASAVIIMICAYSKAILKSRTAASMVGCILVILYAYLYILLQLEDLALLMGSVGLFAVLSAVMYLTRRIDWYAIQPEAMKANHLQ